MGATLRRAARPDRRGEQCTSSGDSGKTCAVRVAPFVRGWCVAVGVHAHRSAARAARARLKAPRRYESAIRRPKA